MNIYLICYNKNSCFAQLHNEAAIRVWKQIFDLSHWVDLIHRRAWRRATNWLDVYAISDSIWGNMKLKVLTFCCHLILWSRFQSVNGAFSAFKDDAWFDEFYFTIRSNESRYKYFFNWSSRSTKFLISLLHMLWYDVNYLMITVRF